MTSNLKKIEKYLSEFWQDYHPPIAIEIKSLWLRNANSSYAFYRSFVALFYKILAQTKNQNILYFKQLSVHKGWVVGDPHPSNFGAILTDNRGLKRSVIYSVNDPDDGYGDSPLYLDFLRFLTGVQIIGLSSVKKIRKAYLQGLRGEGLDEQPREVRNCLKQLRKKEKRIKKRDYKLNYKDLKKKAGSTLRNISSQELLNLQELLKDQWQDSKLKIKSGFEYTRTKGGSGGLKRKVLLVKFSKKNQPFRASKSKWLIVEFKQIRKPASQYLKDFSKKQIKEAQKQSLKWQSCNKPSKLYWFVNDSDFLNKASSVPQIDWLVRPRWVENPVIDPLDVKQKKQRDRLYLYQAKVLGNLHRKKATNSLAYHDDLNLFKAKKWRKATKYLALELETLWKNKDQI